MLSLKSLLHRYFNTSNVFVARLKISTNLSYLKYFNTSNVFVAHLIGQNFLTKIVDFNTSNVFVARQTQNHKLTSLNISIHLMCSLPAIFY
ncbi:conserved hypothetical protein [uncultured Sporomusa sp.]|uniref:Uncharacterized protein n=1 Tax=uncultured Sporomusa sp. TaxID=307249 RepID=A0A212M022_9FIRM|nr:conserved hypothetical protein [uncultured Sporomusa sp.]